MGGHRPLGPTPPCTLTHCFGLWPYETWSVRLQQALLTEDVEGGLTALEGLLDTLDRPWVLGAALPPVGPAGDGFLYRPTPPRPSSGSSPIRTNSTYDLLRNSPRFRALVEKAKS